MLVTLLISPRGGLLAVAWHDGNISYFKGGDTASVAVFDARSGEMLKRFDRYRCRIAMMMFSSDESLLAFRDGFGGASIEHLAVDKPATRLPMSGGIAGFGPRNSYLYCNSMFGLQEWKLPVGKVAVPAHCGHASSATARPASTTVATIR